MNNAEVLIKFKGDSSQLDNTTNKVTNDVTSKLGNAAKGLGTAFLKGTAVASAAMVGMVTKGIQEYAKLEQSIGGVETLFKDSADTVIANAKRAYETAGVDANTYMEQVTSFSASLLQAVGGDTVKAAETADMAIIESKSFPPALSHVIRPSFGSALGLVSTCSSSGLQNAGRIMPVSWK